MKIPNRLAILAGIALAATPVAASEQVATTPVAASAQAAATPAVQTVAVGSDTGIWSEEAGVQKIAEGVWANTEQQQMLREYGCALGPVGLVRDFLAKMEEKGNSPCSPKWYQGLGKVNKEGTMLSLIKLSFSGYLVAESDKGINLTPNHGQWTLYSLDSRSVGRPVMTADTAAPSGDMVVADLGKTLLGGFVNGTGAALVGGLMNPCRGDGGCGDTWTINGGESSAIAANQTEVQSTSILNAAIDSGGCGTGTCVAPNPGHTQD